MTGSTNNLAIDDSPRSACSALPALPIITLRPYGAAKSTILIVTIALTLISCFIGVGLAFHSVTPKFIPPWVQGAGRDSWLVDGATIQLDHLAPVAHVLNFELGDWRPAHLAPATLLVDVCGKTQDPFVIAPPSPQLAVNVPARCNVVKLKFQNWFIPSEGDTRHLGTQFKKFTVSSSIGVPLLRPSFYLSWLVLVTVISLVTLMTVNPASRWRFLVPLVPCAWLPLLAGTKGVRFAQLEDFTLVILAISLGLFIGSAFHRTAKPEKLPRIELQNNRLRRQGIVFSLLCIFVLGGALRFYGLGFGFPRMYHPDEGVKVNVINKMIDGGTWNPKYFQHPSSLLYSTRVTSELLRLTGYEGSNKERIVFAGRLVSATFGTVSILLIYLIACRLYSPWTGLLAAAIFAVLPLHVTCSRYLKEDVLFSALFLATLVAVLKATYEQKRGYLYLAALLAGMAASAKYSGLLAALLIVAAPWFRTRSWRPDWSWVRLTVQALPLIPLGFLLLSPYAAIDFEKFLHGYRLEKMHMLTGHHASIDAWSQYWTYHLSRSFPPGMSPTLFAFGLLGIGFLLYRRRFEDLVIVGLILLFFLPAEWVKAKPAPQPERYILPAIPFLAIAATQFVDELRKRSASRVALLLSLLLVAPPLYRTIQLASELTDDTRAQFLRWVEEHVAPGASFLTESRYAPRVNREKFNLKLIGVKHYAYDFQLDKLSRKPQDFLVVSSLSYDRYFSQPGTNRNIRKRFQQIFNNLTLVKEFKPRYGTYGFHNPTVRLYALKEPLPLLNKEPSILR